MTDLISLLGYRHDSPFRNNPYLDIYTPEGLIDMSQTDQNLIGISELGEIKKMKAGRKNPYKFKGSVVREIPVAQQGGLRPTSSFEKWYSKNTREGLMGVPYNDPLHSFDYKMYYNDMMKGKTAYVDPKSDDHYLDTYKYPNHPSFSIESRYFTNIKDMPHALSYDGDFRKKINYDDTPLGRKYQRGGMTREDLINFLYEDDGEETESKNTAPSEEELAAYQQRETQYQQRISELENQQQYDMALQLAMQGSGEEESPVSGYTPAFTMNRNNNPYTGNYNVSAQGVNNTAKQAYQHYIDKGLQPHIAAGIVGNLMHESAGFNPDVISGKTKGDSGKATGIAQWHPDRFTKLQSWAAKSGRNPFDLKTQLDFVLEEPGEGQRVLNALKKAKNSGEAAVIFSKVYERPGKPMYENRIGYARTLNPYLKGGKY